MTDSQLRYFVTIADTGSYTETALELNISQSSISKQIQSLERDLGVQLINREHRNISLTNEGKQLLPAVRQILDGISNLNDLATKLQPGYKSRLTVLTLPFMSYFSLYVPVSRFELENPSFWVNIVEVEEPQLFSSVKRSSFDIALTYWHEQQLSGDKNTFYPISVDEIVLAVHKDASLAKLERVTTAHLRTVPLMLMEPYTCISDLCMAFFEENKIVPNILFRGRPESIFGGVEARYGAAMLSRKQASYFSPKNVVLLPVANGLPAILGAVVNKKSEANPKVLELVKMLENRD